MHGAGELLTMCVEMRFGTADIQRADDRVRHDVPSLQEHVSLERGRESSPVATAPIPALAS